MDQKSKPNALTRFDNGRTKAPRSNHEPIPNARISRQNRLRSNSRNPNVIEISRRNRSKPCSKPFKIECEAAQNGFEVDPEIRGWTLELFRTICFKKLGIVNIFVKFSEKCYLFSVLECELV